MLERPKGIIGFYLSVVYIKSGQLTEKDQLERQLQGKLPIPQHLNAHDVLRNCEDFQKAAVEMLLSMNGHLFVASPSWQGPGSSTR
jgi:hypothetical protein